MEKKQMVKNNKERKYMKYLIISICSLWLSGCSTMLAHFKIEDSAVYNYGARKALAEKCVEKNYLEYSDVAKYNKFSGLFLDLAVINEQAFKKGYVVTKNGLVNKSDSYLINNCKQGKTFYPNMADELEQHYYARRASLAKTNNAQLSQLNSSLSNTNQNISRSSNNNYSVNPIVPFNANKSITPTPMYNAKQCTGAIINGKCTAIIIPGGVVKKCYGTVVSGKCHGSLL